MRLQVMHSRMLAGGEVQRGSFPWLAKRTGNHPNTFNANMHFSASSIARLAKLQNLHSAGTW